MKKNTSGRFAQDSHPLAAWFLGPRAENGPTWEELVNYILQDYIHWRRNYFASDPVVLPRFQRRSERHEAWVDALTERLDQILNELKGHFPFHSPRYIGHMLSEQSLPSVLGQVAGLLYNPNNVTDEAAPITVTLELEVSRMVAEMLGYNPRTCWAHICSGGTIANLEALWVARTVQLLPFIVREYCLTQQLEFEIKTANGSKKPLQSVENAELITLRPNEALFMLRKLCRQIHASSRRPPAEILDELNSFVRASGFNVARSGFHSIHAQLGLHPVIFVSAAAHYSIKKASNLLGYGEDAVRLIPVNGRFQISTRELRDALFGLKSNEYVAGVIGIVGTTEEGAIDPIHRIRFLRDEFQEKENKSFWLHVDAAWGGYVRSMFCGLGIQRTAKRKPLEDICNEYVEAIGAEETFLLSTGRPETASKRVTVRWSERELYAAFLAMADADSTTIDPHKMGFIPYPAGIIAFRNGLVTELIVQRAQYISDDAGGVKGIEQPPQIDAVGPFILEGSKPGAAALSCWLAHKTIPLTVAGHGKIARTTLLNAKKLFKYLVNHRYMFSMYEKDAGNPEPTTKPFTFVPLFEPDTNVLCYVARPMGWKRRKLVAIDVSLADLNRLNEAIYERLSIRAEDRHIRLSHSQPYFVSRTRLEDEQYAQKTMAPVFARIPVAPDGYRVEGLFVLRSVVMNPWYFAAANAGMDYLLGLVKHLHTVTRDCLEA